MTGNLVGQLLRAGLVAAFGGLAAIGQALGADSPERVTFQSLDGSVVLVGYLFRAQSAGAHGPAVVMMHGRAGAYSNRADGRFDASTLTMRHRAWGRSWAEAGITALLVDGFGPRGYPAGFPIHSYGDRPSAVNEVTVRPGDAYAGYRFLARLPGIDSRRIALQGWSNGGSAALAALAEPIRAELGIAPAEAFLAGLVFYPGCGLQGRFDATYRATAPIRIMIGDADEEVSAERCAGLVARGQRAGSDIRMTVYRGATHSFDDPGRRRQSVAANAEATADAIPATIAFVRRLAGLDRGR